MKHQCALFFLFIVSTIVGMNDRGEPTKYRVACKEIDSNAGRKARSIIDKISTENDPAKLDRVIMQCGHGLDLLRQRIEEKRECVLQGFKNYYDISDYNWEWMRCTTTKNHTLREKNKAQFCADRMGDQEVPECATQFVTKELVACGINTSQVFFSSALKNPAMYEVRVGIKKAIVFINPSPWEKNSIEEKQFISTCVVEELQEKLSLFFAVLKRYWITVIKREKQRDFDGLIKLKMMTRVISMYSGSLRNKQTALLIKKCAKSFDSPDFTPKDYAFISDVAWRLQVLDKAQRRADRLAVQKIPATISVESPSNEGFDESELSGSVTESGSSGSETASESEGSGSDSQYDGQETESESSSSETGSESKASESKEFGYENKIL